MKIQELKWYKDEHLCAQRRKKWHLKSEKYRLCQQTKFFIFWGNNHNYWLKTKSVAKPHLEACWVCIAGLWCQRAVGVTSVRRGNQLPWDSHSQFQITLKSMETTHSAPKFPPEGHVVLLLKLIRKETEEINEKQQRRCIRRHCQGQTHQKDSLHTRVGMVPKVLRPMEDPCEGTEFPLSVLLLLRNHDLRPIHHSRKKPSKSSRIKPCTCPDMSHHLLPNQRNWNWPHDVHWENKERLD